LTAPIAGELFGLGINVITMGNHTFDRKDFEQALANPKVLRPANYPPNVPGQGWGVYAAGSTKIAVINLMGRVYMPCLDCPFRAANEILEKTSREAAVTFVDFHAEVTSEKVAMGWYLDGRVSAVIGTHTHIPTADEQVLPGGTAYLTDAGMTGPAEGVIGMDRDLVLKKFLTGMPQYFAVARGQSVLQGCLLDIDNTTGRARSIKRIHIRE
jgi:metallophosphoesterase (TIGR00282 family)